MGFFKEFGGKKSKKNTQNWENKDLFWIGNDSLIRWKNGQIKALNMMLVTRPRLILYPYIVAKTQNLLSRYQSVSFDKNCAPINIFPQRGGGGGEGGHLSIFFCRGGGGQRDSQWDN